MKVEDITPERLFRIELTETELREFYEEIIMINIKTDVIKQLQSEIEKHGFR